MVAKDLTGNRYGRLTALFRTDDYVAPSGHHCVMWQCQCDCGNIVNVRAKSLMNNTTRSCGCLARELVGIRAAKHHGFGTRLYAIWNSMRQRCNNPNNSAYKNYGARGITICKEWNDFSVFEQWAYSNGYDQSAKRGECTLDRIDVNLGYSPSNCRWVTMKRQSSNKRNTPYYEYQGKRLPLKEWSEVTGIKYETLWRRYKSGWNAEKALTDNSRLLG